MSVEGTPRGYEKKYNFAVEIAGLEVGWFTTCGAIESDIGVVEQHEGGNANAAAQDAGKIKFSQVTLTIGATPNDELYQWHRQVMDASDGIGEVEDAYKKIVNIVQKRRDGSEAKRYKLFKSWPCKLKAGEWDAKADENVTQEMTLVYLYYELVTTAA